MAIPADDILILIRHLIEELAIAKADQATAQAASDAATLALSSAKTRLNAILAIKNSLLQFPDIADTLKSLGIDLQSIGTN